MTTSDKLAAIEARLTADENEYSDPGLYDQSIRDRRALLAIIREQAEKLEAVREVARWIRDNHGDYISREMEDRIRTALGVGDA